MGAACAPSEPPNVERVHEELYPMYLVRVAELLQMRGAPEPHERLRQKGLLHQRQPGMYTIFVSHQWLDPAHPDPRGEQLAVLREALQSIVEGKLQVEEDLVSFPSSKSLSKHDRAKILHGFVFLDWFAIPQITSRAPGVNEDLLKTEAAKAVQSIPAYVEAADLFLALVPESLHSSGGRCNYASWLTRGWCRAEWWCHLLSNKLDTSVVIVYSPKEAEYMFPLNWLQHIVSEGSFTVEADREVVAKLAWKAWDSKIQFLERSCDWSMHRYLVAHRHRLEGQPVAERSLKDFLSHFHFQSLADAVAHPGPMTAMLCAIFSGDVQMVRQLVHHGARPDGRLQGLGHLGYYDTQTLLMAATKSNQKPEMLQVLIDLKADVHAKTRVGLNCGYLVRSPEHVEVLLKGRADLSSPCMPMGLTPLTIAVVWGNATTVRAMLQARCDPNPEPHGMGYGPLLSLTFLARARQDTSEVAETLLASRASVNAAAQPGQKAWYLCSAARAHAALFGVEGSSLVKKTLISLPGLTPLGGAAFVGDEALAQLLLDHGAVAQANDRGDLPEDSARLNGHANVLRLLNTFSV